MIVRFLKRLWATLTTFPVYAGALTAIVVEGGNVLAGNLPGEAAGITHAATSVAAVIGFGSWAVTRLTPVAKELRGFPKASLSAKEQALNDTVAALNDTRAEVDRLRAALAATPPAIYRNQTAAGYSGDPVIADVPATDVLPDTITTPDPGPWKPPSVVAAEKAAVEVTQ